MALFRLLIVKPSSLGDIVQALQVVAAFRQRRPNVHISWVARDSFADVVRASGVADEILIFNRERGLRGLFSCCNAIRNSGKFDAVWDMQGLLRSGIMTFFAKSPRKIGRSDSREGAFLFYNEPVPLPKMEGHLLPHAVEILREFLPTLGIKRSAVPLNFRFTKEEAASAPKIPAKSFVLIAPESRAICKDWPHYDALTAELCAGFPGKFFVWIGIGKKSAPMSKKFPNFFDLQGKTSLLQMIYLLQHAQAVIANDSGCTHLAAAIGKPVLAIYVTTDPQQYGPYPTNAVNHFIALNPPPQFDAKDRFISQILRKKS